MIITITRVVMAVQALASLGVWVGQLQDTFSRMDHGQEVYAQAVLVDILNPLMALALLVAAIFFGRRLWAGPLALTMEFIGIIGALINVITGFYQAGVAIGVAVAVIVLIGWSVTHPAPTRGDTSPEPAR